MGRRSAATIRTYVAGSIFHVYVSYTCTCVVANTRIIGERKRERESTSAFRLFLILHPGRPINPPLFDRTPLSSRRFRSFACIGSSHSILPYILLLLDSTRELSSARNSFNFVSSRCRTKLDRRIILPSFFLAFSSLSCTRCTRFLPIRYEPG